MFKKFTNTKAARVIVALVAITTFSFSALLAAETKTQEHILDNAENSVEKNMSDSTNTELENSKMDVKLAPCPSSPNCVNSQYPEDKDHFIEALALVNNNQSETQAALIQVLSEQDRVKIVSDEPNYIKAEFTSLIFRFTDDVEFLIGESKVDVRSASRVGHSDLGANRNRIEMIRELLNAH